jgi:SPP1 family predicted phage head-tail adaptor
MPIRAGKLDRRIVIQGKVIVISDSGEEQVTWSQLANVWAEKVESTGAERYAAQQLIGRAMSTFRFRWNQATSQVTAGHQILYNGRAYDILDVREIGRREGLEVDCFAPSDQPIVPVVP